VTLDPGELTGERWFADKDRRVAGVRVVDSLEASPDAALLVVEVEFADGSPALYTLPSGARLWPALLEALADGPRGRFELRHASGLRGIREERLLGIDQSNTSYVLDERIVLKCYRRLQAGANPEVELVTLLSDVPEVPAARGSVHYAAADGSARALALLQDYVADARDGWAWAVELLQALLSGERSLEAATAWGAELGAVSRRLHEALAGAALGARPAGPDDLRAWRGAAEDQLERVLELVDGGTAAELAAEAGRIRSELASLETPARPPLLTRVHGDYHLGQILRSRAGFHVIDFEGEPTKTPEERRALGSPLRDVAAMLRSFDHVARWVLREFPDPASRRTAEAWIAEARGRFLAAYGPVDAGLLRAFEVEKETYEFSYAATFLPSWMFVPRASMRALLAEPSPR